MDNVDALQSKHLLEVLSLQYKHIIDTQEAEEISPEKIIEYIISYYEGIINGMPGNVYWLDKNCITVGCNKNVLDMFGFKTINDFKGLNFEEMGKAGNWGVDAIESFKKDTLEVIRTGKPRLNIEEPPIPHQDGRTIHFLTSRVPLFDRLGNVIGAVGISIDISELKSTQAALKEAKENAEAANHKKSEFIANMSHDIKTPLSGIIGIAELLTYRLKDENLEFAQTLLMSGQQLLNFFENCLKLFKVEYTDIAFVTEQFNLRHTLNEIYDLFLPAAKAKELVLNIHFSPQVPESLIGNRAGIYTILLNLIGNAVKFTNQGFVNILIDAEKHPYSKEVTIKLTAQDSGIGIPIDKQQIIFERFTRLIPSYKGIYEGSGIGLYLVKKFIKTMQGQITVESEEGKGSKFVISLPFQIPSLMENDEEDRRFTILPPPFLTNTPLASINNVKPFDSPIKILLVEDNLAAQRMQSSLLASMNCEVDVVNCGEAALEMFEPGKYDLIFMDIGLPGMQGDMVSKYIRKMEQGSNFHVPIIALTAHITADVDQYCLSAGIESIFSKPLSREQAQQIIMRYLADWKRPQASK